MLPDSQAPAIRYNFKSINVPNPNSLLLLRDAMPDAATRALFSRHVRYRPSVSRSQDIERTDPNVVVDIVAIVQVGFCLARSSVVSGQRVLRPLRARVQEAAPLSQVVVKSGANAGNTVCIVSCRLHRDMPWVDMLCVGTVCIVAWCACACYACSVFLRQW